MLNISKAPFIMETIFDPNIHRDDLICPITLELLRDPVIAKDGHVYEREAITRWIIEHKTSPLTRQPLEIQDLFPATHIRHIIEQRRSSLVSHNTSYMTAIDVLSTEQINTKHAIKSSQRKTNNCSKKVLIWLCILLLIGILLSIVLPVVLRVRSKEENFNTVSSRYASSLTNQHPTLKLDNYYLYYYEAIQVIPSISGTYEFTIYSDYDMMTRFYVSDFNPLYPNDKLMLFSNYGREKDRCKFMVTLSKQSIYYLVVMTESVSITRSFSIVVTGSSDVDFNCMPTPLPRTTRAPVSTTTSSSVVKTIYLTDLDIYNPTFRRLNAQDGNYFYDILQLLISVNGFYNFTSDSLHNICLYIYVNKFNPLKPNKNLVGSSDYHDYLSCSHVVTYLHTNSTFFLVVTTWAPDVIGVYSVTGAGPAYLTFWRTTPSSI